MTPAAILALSLLQPAAGVQGAAADRCLPGDEGFLAMRLRGSIEADIRWQEPELDCTGMSRPDARGLRLRFSGRRDGGELAVVFAAPALAAGASARGVPVNVTLLDGAGERIYGTQGDRLCVLDFVEQQALEGAGLPPRSFRVSARGFCTAPARAVDGDGAVLLTRFDFAGRVTWREDDGTRKETRPPPDPFTFRPKSDLSVVTASGTHRFRVGIAADEASRQRGLMFVRRLPANQGMLFLFPQARLATFWMRNTYISLDIAFIAEDGTVVNVVEHTTPLSLEPIESLAPVVGVLELVAGTAKRIGLKAGDRIVHEAFAPQQKK